MHRCIKEVSVIFSRRQYIHMYLFIYKYLNRRKLYFSVTFRTDAGRRERNGGKAAPSMNVEMK